MVKKTMNSPKKALSGEDALFVRQLTEDSTFFAHFHEIMQKPLFVVPKVVKCKYLHGFCCYVRGQKGSIKSEHMGELKLGR